MAGLIDYKINGITLQQIQIFCLAAECENLTETAKRIHMTQASVSRNISTIESNLGIMLFHRYKKRIALTDAGRQLAIDWRSVLKAVANSAEQARKTQENAPMSVFLADYYTVNSASYLLPFVEQLEAARPAIVVHVEKTDPYSIFTGLKERHYDAAFFSADGEPMLRDAGLEYMRLFSLLPGIVYSSKHRLAGLASPATADFANETIVAMTDEQYKFYLDMVENIYRQCGFKSDIKYVNNAHTMAFELLRGKCIAIMDETYMLLTNEAFRFHKLEECDAVLGYGISWSPDNKNPLLKEMLSFARTSFRK